MKIRDTRTSDFPAIARVRIDTWRSAYAGIVSDEYLAGMTYQRDEEWMSRNPIEQRPPEQVNLVVEDGDGSVVAFLAGGPEREGDAQYDSEIYAIYILPSHQRLGIGRALVVEAAQRLLARGMSRLLIWVLEDNHPARAFYAALGGEPAREKPIEIGGRVLAEVGYGYDTRALIKALEPGGE